VAVSEQHVEASKSLEDQDANAVAMEGLCTQSRLGGCIGVKLIKILFDPRLNIFDTAAITLLFGLLLHREFILAGIAVLVLPAISVVVERILKADGVIG
jgi:hypothetical protein